MDLADQIDDYICTFEGIGDLTMDALAMFIFVWAVLALFLLWLCKFLYNKYVVKKDITQTVTSKTTASGSINNISGAIKLDNATGDKLRRSEPREILASKDIKELSTAKQALGGSGAKAGGLRGRSGGVYVPPTPPVRKRLTRRSPGPAPELRRSRSIQPPANVVGPETTSVTWTSQVFRWLYSDLVIVNELLNVWVMALNENLRKTYDDHGICVEIVRVLPDSPPPSLANLYCHAEDISPAEMVITCDCNATPILQVRAYREKAGKTETSHYKVTISRFQARLSAAMNYNTLKGEMKVEGYPDIKIAMNSVGAIKAIDQDDQQIQDLISESLTSALRDTIYPVDFSIYATCPRAEIEPESSALDGFNALNNRFSGTGPAISTGKRLLVKIVKGDGLINAKDPYCVVEMDEPPQKNQTGARQGNTPYWDEHFLFDISPQSAEILFEVYDRSVKPNDPPKFLGLGLVGIDELSVGPASSQILALQPRPYETENVCGAITVEFVFIEGAEIPSGPRPYKLKEALKISTPSINEHLKNGADLADAAVRALQEGVLTSSGNPSKSTLIIHSVQRNNRSSPFKFGRPMAQSSPRQYQTNGNGMPLNHSDNINQQFLDDERGRTRKKRDFLGTLKRRLGRSKTRTKSMDRGMIPIDPDNPNGEARSLSADRGTLTNSTSMGPRLVVPTLDQSRRSSLSESSAISGFSTASTKTYLHEASALVLETLENGVKRHFLVPLAIAMRPRWRRKGTKLHIYNDHTFVAKHLSGSGLICAICTKSIPRRPGKQGYECRDCQLICHKQCHIRAPQACSNPTILSMELSSFPVLTDSQV